MDAWMRRPGTRVEGHRAVARSAAGGPWQVVCSCGHRSGEQSSSSSACLALVRHLELAVRGGAAVLPGPGGDGDAGVREPRRPSPPALPGAVALALVEHDGDA